MSLVAYQDNRKGSKDPSAPMQRLPESVCSKSMGLVQVCVCPHRADGNGDARLVHGADAFVMRGFDDGDLLLLFWEAGDRHGAANAGVARHHRFSGDELAAF